MTTVTVSVSDIGNAIVVLDAEYRAMEREKTRLAGVVSDLRRQQDAVDDRLKELSKAINKMLACKTDGTLGAYDVTRLGWNELRSS